MIPGGVNSPVRAFRAVGGDPPFIVRGQGSRVWDADGKEYLDLVAGIAVLGSVAGALFAGRVDACRLRTWFGWFVIAMGVFVLAQELPRALARDGRAHAVSSAVRS